MFENSTSFIAGLILGSLNKDYIGVPTSIITTGLLGLYTFKNKQYLFDKSIEYYTKMELFYENYFNSKETDDQKIKIHHTFFLNGVYDIDYEYKNKRYNVLLNSNNNTLDKIENLIKNGKRNTFTITKACICSDNEIQNVDDVIERYMGPNKDFYNGNEIKIKAKEIIECIVEFTELNDYYLLLNISYRGKDYEFRFNSDDEITLDFTNKTTNSTKTTDTSETTSDGYIKVD